MPESVIFNSPFILIFYLLAFVISLIDFKRRTSGYICTIATAIIFIFNTVYALLLSATLYEVATVTMIFLLLNLLSYKNTEGDE